ncbi:hypothetical protein [Glutamicibacter sp.]|uniref:hypothetical protein n=1 Tax=Glutamicibacter sp. TaxID=1931995 RepID=UPI0028BD1B8E|nr:hypothetical protein [Glutamicibacter sp.]
MKRVNRSKDATELASAAPSSRKARNTKTAVKFRSVLGALGVTSALIFGLGVGAAPPASAADHSMKTLGDVLFPGQDAGGSMWFNTYGDVVTVCDREADGRYAVLYVYNEEAYGVQRYKVTAKGDGNCTTRKASMGSPYNLREGKTFGFLLCTATKEYPDGAYCNAATWRNSN